MRAASILFIASMAAIGTPAQAQDGSAISDFCRDVLKEFEEQIAANGLIVTETVEGGSVRMARGEYLDVLRRQLEGLQKECLRFVVLDAEVVSPNAPAPGI